jgi:hypothetical protein
MIVVLAGAELRRRIAEEAGLAGGIPVYCRSCGITELVDGEEALRSGWPKHCGATMSLDREAMQDRARYPTSPPPEEWVFAFARNVEGGRTEWELVPSRYRPGLDRWISYGVKPGHFLSALLCNDVIEAAARADAGATGEPPGAQIRPILIFLMTNAPPDCFGSAEKFAAWQERGGLKGHQRG